MAPSIPLVAAVLISAHAHLDESSLLQVPITNNQLGTDEDECRCPGYYQEQCEAEAAQGCVWTDAGESNEPWCQCLNIVPLPPIIDPVPPIIVTLPPPLNCAGTYEAEDATINGGHEHPNAASSSNHAGFTGRSFVDYVNPNDDYVEWSVPSCSGGPATLSFRYALSAGNRPLQVLVNGEDVESALSFPGTGSWATWSSVSVQVQLREGVNVVRLVATGSSGANMDSLTISHDAQQCDIGAGTYEAEDATINGGQEHPNADSSSNHAGFTGRSFVDYLNPNDDYVEWSVQSCSGGSAIASFRYALSAGDRPLQVIVNDEEVAAALSFPGTGSWATWSSVSVPVQLRAGVNVIRLVATGSSGANMDALVIASA